MTCVLCAQDGGELLHRDAQLRVVLVDEADYPGFCRVVWNAHVAEMSDLDPAARTRLMEAVNAVEAAIRETMSPDKVNLASLGNQVPHLHWHVIPRHAGDRHFPGAVWAPAQREPDPAALQARRALLPALRAALARRLAQLPAA
ncbi:MAG: histidine triad protein [Paucimonas sp.]|nr:histidine triad protein [Paucimonas sp.]